MFSKIPIPATVPTSGGLSLRAAEVRPALLEKCREGLFCFSGSDSGSEFVEFTTDGLTNGLPIWSFEEFLAGSEGRGRFPREVHCDFGSLSPDVLVGNDGRHEAKLVCASRTERLTQENHLGRLQISNLSRQRVA